MCKSGLYCLHSGYRETNNILVFIFRVLVSGNIRPVWINRLKLSGNFTYHRVKINKFCILSSRVCVFLMGKINISFFYLISFYWLDFKIHKGNFCEVGTQVCMQFIWTSVFKNLTPGLSIYPKILLPRLFVLTSFF